LNLFSVIDYVVSYLQARETTTDVRPRWVLSLNVSLFQRWIVLVLLIQKVLINFLKM